MWPTLSKPEVWLLPAIKATLTHINQVQAAIQRALFVGLACIACGRDGFRMRNRGLGRP